MNGWKTAAIAAAVTIGSSANAMNHKGKGFNLEVGAMIDAYYLYDFNRPTEGGGLNARNYDRRHNDITLNLFELNFHGEYDKVHFYVDLDFGDFADQNNAETAASTNGDDVQNSIYHNLGQAYVTYEFNKNWALSFGKMYTHVGYEVAKAQDNWNYSRSFAFSVGGPFWHDGIALNYQHDNGFSAGLYIYDRWDNSGENNHDKSVGVQLGYANKVWHITGNFIAGAEASGNNNKKSVFELNTQYMFNNDFHMAFDFVYGVDEEVAANATTGGNLVDQEWSAYVLYAHWKPSSQFSLTPRIEMFQDDTSGAASSGYLFGSSNSFGNASTRANDLLGLTLTATYHHNATTELRAEFRNDSADENLWNDDDGSGTDSQSTFSLSWLMRI